MSTTDDTNATRRGSESNDLLGLVPERDTAASEMSRLLDLSARQAAEIERLRALIQRVAKYPASVDCAGTLLRADVLREAGPPETWRA